MLVSQFKNYITYLKTHIKVYATVFHSLHSRTVFSLRHMLNFNILASYNINIADRINMRSVLDVSSRLCYKDVRV
jgi:hypothetical protein